MSKFIRKDSIAPLCACGCGEEVKRGNRFVNGHNSKGKNNPMYGKHEDHFLYGKKRPEHSKKMAGENNPMFGKAHSQETRKLQSEKRKGKCKGNKNPAKKIEARKKIPESKKGKPRSKETRQKISKKMIEIMLNGHAAYMLSFVKSSSKPQVKLFNLIKQLYPQAILNYPSLNRSIDIAIADKMIAIEYDGSYWHQDKEADAKRQKELEEIGWKFLRYCDYIPSTKELKNDLQQIGC